MPTTVSLTVRGRTWIRELAMPTQEWLLHCNQWPWRVGGAMWHEAFLPSQRVVPNDERAANPPWYGFFGAAGKAVEPGEAVESCKLRKLLVSAKMATWLLIRRASRHN